jgi:hypothetical protein
MYSWTASGWVVRCYGGMSRRSPGLTLFLPCAATDRGRKVVTMNSSQQRVATRLGERRVGRERQLREAIKAERRLREAEHRLAQAIEAQRRLDEAEHRLARRRAGPHAPAAGKPDPRYAYLYDAHD